MNTSLRTETAGGAGTAPAADATTSGEPAVEPGAAGLAGVAVGHVRVEPHGRRPEEPVIQRPRRRRHEGDRDRDGRQARTAHPGTRKFCAFTSPC